MTHGRTECGNACLGSIFNSRNSPVVDILSKRFWPMTLIQAFCCSIGPAMASLVAGYLVIRLTSSVTKRQKDHNDIDWCSHLLTLAKIALGFGSLVIPTVFGSNHFWAWLLGGSSVEFCFDHCLKQSVCSVLPRWSSLLLLQLKQSTGNAP